MDLPTRAIAFLDSRRGRFALGATSLDHLHGTHDRDRDAALRSTPVRDRSSSPTTNAIHALQATAGNRAVAALLAGGRAPGPVVQRDEDDEGGIGETVGQLAGGVASGVSGVVSGLADGVTDGASRVVRQANETVTGAVDSMVGFAQGVAEGVGGLVEGAQQQDEE